MGEERADVAESAGATGGGRGAGKRHLGRTNVHAVLDAADGCAPAAGTHAGDQALRGSRSTEQGQDMVCGKVGGWGQEKGGRVECSLS